MTEYRMEAWLETGGKYVITFKASDFELAITHAATMLETDLCGAVLRVNVEEVRA